MFVFRVEKLCCLAVAVMSFFMTSCGLGGESGSSSGHGQYVIEILGSKTAIEKFDVRVEGLETTSVVYFGSNQFVRKVRFTRPLSELEGLPIVMESLDGNVQVDTISLEPYMCKSRKDYKEKISKGWVIIEKHQLKLSDEGQLFQGSNFDHMLAKTCEVTSPDGKNGEGESTWADAPLLCEQTDRAQTDVPLVVADKDGEVVLKPSICSLTYLHKRGGMVGGFFIYPITEKESFEMFFHYDTRLEAAEYPFVIQGGKHDFLGDLIVFEIVEDYGILQRAIFLSEGKWTIDEVTWGEFARIKGSIDFVFEDPKMEGRKYIMKGPFDMPLLRFPKPPGEN